MYKLLALINHLLTATNQHGVHSPFVYDFVTKCLYSKPIFKGSKSESVLLKSLTYFSTKSLKLVTEGNNISTRIEKELDLSFTEKQPYDMIYLDHIDPEVLSKHQEMIHNDSMILIGNIHKNKNATAIWNKMIKDERITVSIDMLYCGALFIRREQRKEHFKIRI